MSPASLYVVERLEGAWGPLSSPLALKGEGRHGAGGPIRVSPANQHAGISPISVTLWEGREPYRSV